MAKFHINTQSLAKHCEVCHQADCFDADKNYCSRCDHIISSPMPSNVHIKKRQSPASVSPKVNVPTWIDAVKGAVWGAIFGSVFTAIIVEFVCGAYWSRISVIGPVLEGAIIGTLYGVIFSMKSLFDQNEKTDGK